MLMLHRGDTVSHVARTLCCARSSIGRWINWCTQSGAEGLKSLPSGRGRCRPFGYICALLRELVKHSPGDFGYQRSRWSTELLAIKIRDITGCPLHASAIRRWLPAAGLVWRRAAPTLRIRDPNKEDKMAAIKVALASCSAEHPKMKWISTSPPKSVLTGSYAGSKSALSRRARMKSTVLPARCTVVRAKSATLVETVKLHPYLSVC